MAIDTLLGRLEGVRQTGPCTWRARCPAHDSKGLTLSVREIDGNRVLLHCFAGCDTNDVLAAIGLEMSDLMSARVGDYFKPERMPFPVSDVLRCVAFEGLVIVHSGITLMNGLPFSQEDRERLMLATQRIQAALTASGVGHG